METTHCILNSSQQTFSATSCWVWNNTSPLLTSSSPPSSPSTFCGIHHHEFINQPCHVCAQQTKLKSDGVFHGKNCLFYLNISPLTRPGMYLWNLYISPLTRPGMYLWNLYISPLTRPGMYLWNLIDATIPESYLALSIQQYGCPSNYRQL